MGCGRKQSLLIVIVTVIQRNCYTQICNCYTQNFNCYTEICNCYTKNCNCYTEICNCYTDKCNCYTEFMEFMDERKALHCVVQETGTGSTEWDESGQLKGSVDRTQEWAHEIMMLHITDRAMYASQRTLYGSPTQGTHVEKTKRWADESQHIQYGSRRTEIRNHRLLPRGHQRNIGRKADERNCGISGAPNGGVPLLADQRNLGRFGFGTRQTDSSDESGTLSATTEPSICSVGINGTVLNQKGHASCLPRC